MNSNRGIGNSCELSPSGRGGGQRESFCLEVNFVMCECWRNWSELETKTIASFVLYLFTQLCRTSLHTYVQFYTKILNSFQGNYIYRDFFFMVRSKRTVKSLELTDQSEALEMVSGLQRLARVLTEPKLHSTFNFQNTISNF